MFLIEKQFINLFICLFIYLFSYVFIYLFFLLQRFYIRKDLQRIISLSSGPFIYIYNIQYNYAFLIYNALQAVLERPFHDKVPRKHAANWQANTSHRSVIPRTLLLGKLTEITLWHRCPGNSSYNLQDTPKTEHFRGKHLS